MEPLDVVKDIGPGDDEDSWGDGEAPVSPAPARCSDTWTNPERQVAEELLRSQAGIAVIVARWRVIEKWPWP